MINGGIINTVAAAASTCVNDIFGDNSCVSTYQFNGNTNDLSGNYNATPSATLSYVTGVYNQAVVMDNRWITVPSTATTPLNYGSENFAISLWARFDNVNAQVILSKWGTGASGNRTIFFYMNGGQWTVFERTTSNATSSVVANTTFVTGQWYNIVYSRNPTTAFMYVNGQLDNQQSKTTNIKTDSSTPFYFGRVVGSTGGTVTGDYDQARFFNRSLSSSEVQDLYNEVVC